MKYLSIAILTAVICSSAWAAEPEHTLDCWKTAETQADLNICSLSESDAADAKLNRLYKAIERRYKKDAVFLKQLHKAKIAWAKYRDAQIDMKYPPHTEPLYYGTIHPLCVGDYYRQLTQARISELKEWLKPLEEGDVCGISDPDFSYF